MFCQWLRFENLGGVTSGLWDEKGQGRRLTYRYICFVGDVCYITMNCSSKGEDVALIVFLISSIGHVFLFPKHLSN